MELNELNHLIKETLDEAKALEITEIDVRNMTDVCDSIFICTATSGRHARSIERRTLEAVRLHNIRPLGTDENADDSWVLVDLNRTVIHIMLEETRGFYNLEQLWDLTTNSRESHAD